jgi:hypothetical protein
MNAKHFRQEILDYLILLVYEYQTIPARNPGLLDLNTASGRNPRKAQIERKT